MPLKTLPGIAALAALLWSGSALAHAHLVASMPADKSTVSAPSEISMRFNGPLVSRVSAIKLTDARGGEVTVTLKPTANAAELSGSLEKPLAPGTYRATWTADGEDDGHRMSGNISFTVK